MLVKYKAMQKGATLHRLLLNLDVISRELTVPSPVFQQDHLLASRFRKAPRFVKELRVSFGDNLLLSVLYRNCKSFIRTYHDRNAST